MPRLCRFSAAISQHTAAKKAVNGEPERFVPWQCAGIRRGAAKKAVMRRKLIWIDQERFRGFGCSECDWRFKPSRVPVGKSLDEMMRNFELLRDREFTSHVCAHHSKEVR
jgi:hypothetical protein